VSERLQKVLARAGLASRRKAEALILAGKVTVNGKRAELGMKVGSRDEIRVNGKVVEPQRELVSYALYKPVGVVSTARDERGRPTVLDFLPKAPGLHPVGRLDRDSEGLLLVTNDGELTLRVTHPRFGHHKEYRVWCKEGTLQAHALRRLKEGVRLEDGLAKAIGARPAPGGAVIVLGEGRKRQLRRMLSSLGYTVTRLLRTKIGGLGLEGLKPGGYRKLTAADLKKLGYTPEDERIKFMPKQRKRPD
jgi:23S rRNA pseudouridine2605 synthase